MLQYISMTLSHVPDRFDFPGFSVTSANMSPWRFIFSWRVLGTVANFIPVIIYLAGCALTRFKCSGDDMGGLMLMYALTIFLPNAAIIIILFLDFLIDFSKRRIFNTGDIVVVLYLFSIISLIMLQVISGWIAEKGNEPLHY